MAYRVVAKLCHDSDCCPEVYVDSDPEADSSTCIRITDDFGGEIHMIVDQLQVLIDKIRNGEISLARVFS